MTTENKSSPERLQPEGSMRLEGEAAIDLYKSKLGLNIQAMSSQAAVLNREIATLSGLLREIEALAAADKS